MMYARHVLMDQGEETFVSEDSNIETESASVPPREPQLPHGEFERLRQKLGFSPPRLIDQRYRVERLLGHGSMGEVYLAHDQRLARQVALKLVRTDSTASTRLQARLQREALALARVDHPNVIGIHDVGSHDGQTYFTMQFVPGITLRKWLAAKHTDAEILDVYLQAARGLAAAHSVNVVHRDFKPDNVLVGHDGVVRVLDFGLAGGLRPGSPIPATTEREESRPVPEELTDSGSAETLLAESEPARVGSDWDRMTQTGALLGTLAYMASEQLAGREADARSDQFGFCVAMWEALTGTRPFVDSTSMGSVGLLANIERGPNGAMPRLRWLRAMLVRGLAFEPEQRWPSMAALIEAIERRRTRGRKLGLGLALSGAIIGASLIDRVVPAEVPPPPESCDAFVSKIDAVWTMSMREEIASHRKLNGHAADRAITNLDKLASDWKTTATGLCEGELAPVANDPTRMCLERWLGGFGETIALLAQRSDAQTLANAPDLLVALAPINSDYCMAVPANPAIWQMTVHARMLAAHGNMDAAVERANRAFERANRLDTHTFSSERALAHLARGEIAMFSGDNERATEEFELAARNAYAPDAKRVLIEAWTLKANLLANTPAPGNAERASAHVDQAEFQLATLPGERHDVARAQLLDARAFVERARALSAPSAEERSEHYEQAIALHRQAQTLYLSAKRPTLAAKALLNIGFIHQKLAKPEDARRCYTDALALLDAAAHLPPTYRTRVYLEHYLGLLADDETGPRALAEALRHYKFVLEYGNEKERFDMHELILLLTLEIGDPELIQEWVKRAAAAHAARPNPTIDETFRMQRAVGFGLALLDDPRGELVLVGAERSAEMLPLIKQFNLQVTWVDWLESIGRCEEAAERREQLAIRVAKADPELMQQHAAWQAAGPVPECAENFREPRQR
jgi:serine/threonine protein kinase/tetratricopeptide (TPR) repeat protein